jgi:hypothetical protein
MSKIHVEPSVTSAVRRPPSPCFKRDGLVLGLTQKLEGCIYWSLVNNWRCERVYFGDKDGVLEQRCSIKVASQLVL